MQFLITAYDGKDVNAVERRLSVRAKHLELGDRLVASGKMLFGVAILDDKQQMIGSALIVEFENRAALDDWLRIEPYVTGEVWADIKVEPCRVGPSFTNLVRGGPR
jgi:uncharacterized protein